MTDSMMNQNRNNGNTASNTGGILLSLPQCDMERPSKGIESSITAKKSIKTTSKRADMVLFELPEATASFCDDLWKGRCKILASNQSASIVTPTNSLKLVTVGTSNALIVWNKDDEITKGQNNEENATGPNKRLKRTTQCRLIQPGGSGSSFLVGQPYKLDPTSVHRFFAEQSNLPPVSTKDLCNRFQVGPTQLREALLKVSAVVSYSKLKTNDNTLEEFWHLVPEEEVLFGQQALVETLCEEDFDFEDESCDEERLQTSSLEAVAIKVSQRLVPLLMETVTISSDSSYTKEDRSMAISRKTVLLASTLSLGTKATIGRNSTHLYSHWSKHCFVPNASKIAFFVLRDLFLKYPSYAWCDLSERWRARLPLGQQYEAIVSTTEWIEDAKLGGHGGLVPNQLVFSSSGGGNGDEKGSTNGSYSNAKGVLSLVDSHAVLAWGGD